MDEERIETEDKSIGFYTVACHDIYTLRILFEILGTISSGSKSCIFFSSKGIKLVGSCGNKRSLMITHLKANNFLDYRMEGNKPVDVDGVEKDDVELYVSVKEIYDCFKSVAKKDSRTIRVCYDINGIATGLDISSHGDTSTVDSVNTLPMFDINIFQDMFEKHYSTSRPTVNITIQNFSTLLSRLKDRLCTAVEFVHVPGDGILVIGYSNGNAVSSTRFYSNNTSIDDDIPSNKPIPIKRKKTKGRFKLKTEHKILIEGYKSKSAWIGKIGKSCCPSSVINIYLEAGKPLIIGTFNGAMGYTRYCFTNKPPRPS